VTDMAVTGWMQADEQAESKKLQYKGLITNKQDTGRRNTG